MFKRFLVVSLLSCLCYVNAFAEERFFCDAAKHTVIVSTTSSGEYLYRAWNKPKHITQKPDMEIIGGTEVVEGTGPCRYAAWSFAKGNVQYVVSTLGCTEAMPPAGATGSLAVYIDGELRKSWWCMN